MIKVRNLCVPVIAALSLTGCYNMRTDVNEPLEKCTFGESCEHYLLFAHDCRRSPKKCNPICDWDKKKFDENRIFSEKNWEKFKNFDPEKYKFQKTDIILFDNMNPIIQRLAFQIKQEIIVPYIELDKEGLIATYNMFMADVAIFQKNYQMDMRTACIKTFEMWQKKYGKERCKRLKAAFPLIQSLAANKVLCNAITRNSADVAKLLLQLKQGTAQLKSMTKDWQGIVRISAASLITLNALNELVMATGYLAVYQDEKLAVASHAEEYLKQFKTEVL